MCQQESQLITQVNQQELSLDLQEVFTESVALSLNRLRLEQE
jgi:hypothetical protein